MTEIDKDKVVAILNRILEMELAGVVRYTHYSLLVFGYGRIPIVAWMREQANEALVHAQQVGEWITHLGAYPSLEIGALLDSHKLDIGDMLRESLQTESAALAQYRQLLDLVRDDCEKSLALERARKLLDILVRHGERARRFSERRLPEQVDHGEQRGLLGGDTAALQTPVHHRAQFLRQRDDQPEHLHGRGQRFTRHGDIHGGFG